MASMHLRLRALIALVFVAGWMPHTHCARISEDVDEQKQLSTPTGDGTHLALADDEKVELWRKGLKTETGISSTETSMGCACGVAVVTGSTPGCAVACCLGALFGGAANYKIARDDNVKQLDKFYGETVPNYLGCIEMGMGNREAWVMNDDSVRNFREELVRVKDLTEDKNAKQHIAKFATRAADAVNRLDEITSNTFFYHTGLVVDDEGGR